MTAAGELLRMDRSPTSKDVQDIRAAVRNPASEVSCNLNCCHLQYYGDNYEDHDYDCHYSDDGHDFVSHISY